MVFQPHDVTAENTGKTTQSKMKNVWKKDNSKIEKQFGSWVRVMDMEFEIKKGGHADGRNNEAVFKTHRVDRIKSDSDRLHMTFQHFFSNYQSRQCTAASDNRKTGTYFPIMFKV